MVSHDGVKCCVQIEPVCLSLVPGFPGCLEDEEYPTTSLQFALYHDLLRTRKLTNQPEGELEYPGDANIRYIPGFTSVFSPQHWDNYEGFLCPSRVSREGQGETQ